MESTINLTLIYRDFSCQAFDTLEFPRGADAPQETSFHNLDTKSVKSARSTVRIRVNGTLEHSEHLVSLRLPFSFIIRFLDAFWHNPEQNIDSTNF